MAEFRCTNCDNVAPRAELICSQCGAANAYAPVASAAVELGRSRGGRARAEAGRVVRLGSVSAADHKRLVTGIGEFDRVAGGGLVTGSLILLAGPPGIGKSTLVIQITDAFVKQGTKSLYVTGEESAAQIRMRAERLGLDLDSLNVLASTSVEEVEATLAEHRPTFAVIDSIQTIGSTESEGVSGGMSQVRSVSTRLKDVAKKLGITLLLIGHVTKETTVAGPKTLEHLVDAVLMLEGDHHGFLRLLRASKNRYGAVDEVGLFEMRDTGMHGTELPAPLAVAGGEDYGRAVSPILEGTRPLLVEVQALVASASNAGNPRRVALGIPDKRVAMLLAVLERYTGINLAAHDVYVQISSGITVNEPGVDAAICAAIASSYWSTPLPDDVQTVVGEVGLGGEIRPVRGMNLRDRETRRLTKGILTGPATHETMIDGYKAVANVEELLKWLGLLAPEGAEPVEAGKRHKNFSYSGRKPAKSDNKPDTTTA